ncbi:MAG: fucose isomerase, partial [Desulfurococcales archaeon ex4484_58]
IIFLDEPLTSYQKIDLSKYDLVIIHHLTGGTSSLAVELTTDINRPVILIASGAHNALASALSARAKMIYSRIKVKLIHYIDLDDLKEKFEILYRGVLTGDLLRKLKILEVNETGETSPMAHYYMDRVGGMVETVSFKELIEIAENASKNNIKNLIRDISDHIDLTSVEEEYLEKAVRIYYALNDVVEKGGYRAVTIDCFPMIMAYKVTPCLALAMLNARGIPASCENDFYSLPLLIVSRYLTGRAGWIANPSGVTSDGYLRFAHCTIAPSLGLDCRLTSHFETGQPYAVTCRYSFREVVFGRFDREFNVLRVYRGKVVDSGMLEKMYCRTQLIIDPSPLSPDEFIGEALGNHHVFMPLETGLFDSLDYLAWWMDWKLEVRS